VFFQDRGKVEFRQNVDSIRLPRFIIAAGQLLLTLLEEDRYTVEQLQTALNSCRPAIAQTTGGGQVYSRTAANSFEQLRASYCSNYWRRTGIL
jgi:hypothetical protein